MFEETGCEKCRDSWSHPFGEKTLVDLEKTNFTRQTRLFKCSSCGAYWEDQNGAFPSGITEKEAKEYYGIK
jgi:hypothetical protein